MSAGAIFPDWDLLHPIARGPFMALADDLVTGHRLALTRSLFRPFELYRPPDRQRAVVKAGHSKAQPWQSAHQYGLAVDYVARVRDRWSWDTAHDWDFLRKCATARGLRCEIEWDRPHVEHPAWERVKEALRPQISGTLP